MCSPSGLLRVGDLGLGGDLNQRRRILVQPGYKFLAAFRGMVIGNPCGITAVLRSIPSCGGDAPRYSFAAWLWSSALNVYRTL